DDETGLPLAVHQWREAGGGHLGGMDGQQRALACWVVIGGEGAHLLGGDLGEIVDPVLDEGLGLVHESRKTVTGQAVTRHSATGPCATGQRLAGRGRGVLRIVHPSSPSHPQRSPSIPGPKEHSATCMRSLASRRTGITLSPSELRR